MHTVVNLGPWSIAVLAKSTWISEENLRSGASAAAQTLVDGASSPVRKNEVLRSRWLIRTVFKQLDPVRGAEGHLEWPDGVCGSISHKHGHVAAAVSLLSSDLGLGIDLEQQTVAEKIATRILTEVELERLALFGERAERAAAGFAAKEAIFKAVFPLTRARFWFEDAEILEAKTRHDESDGTTTYVLSVKIGPRAGGPEGWDRLCSVYLKDTILDGEYFWLAASGITDTVFNAKF